MRATVSQYARALEGLLSAEKKEDRKILVKNFVAYLRRRREQKKLPAIIKQFERLENERLGYLPVTAVTAHHASESLARKLRRQAEEMFPDKKIELTLVTGQEVVGGVRLQTEDILYDATLATELKILRKQLLGA